MSVAWPQKTVKGLGPPGQCETSRPLYGIRRKASKGPLGRRGRVLQNPHAWGSLAAPGAGKQVPPSPLWKGSSLEGDQGSSEVSRTLCRLSGIRIRGTGADLGYGSWQPSFGLGSDRQRHATPDNGSRPHGLLQIGRYRIQGQAPSRDIANVFPTDESPPYEATAAISARVLELGHGREGSRTRRSGWG